MTELTINERLAVLETKMDEVQNDASKRDIKQDAILDTVTQLQRDMSSAKSFMGGAMWIGMGMVTVLWKIFPWLVSLFKVKTNT